MKQRIITGIIIALIAIPCLVLGGYFLEGLIVFLTAVASYEICNLIGLKKYPLMALLFVSMLVLYHCDAAIYGAVLSIVMVVLCIVALFYQQLKAVDLAMVILMMALYTLGIQGLMRTETYGVMPVLFIALATYGCDIGAYFFGVTLGKHKMCPTISPKKTWEGSIGGWFVGCVSSALLGYFTITNIDFTILLVNSIFLPIVAQAGDLTFSLFKRHYGIKDYSQLMPGHGGVFDRVDSLIFSFIIFNAILILMV